MSKINVIEGNGMFPHARFKDQKNNDCTIMISTLADDRCIWLGIVEVNPKIRAIHAEKNGIITEQKVGWVDFPIPDEVLLSSKMHLNMEQVKELLPLLQKFAETGEIS